MMTKYGNVPTNSFLIWGGEKLYLFCMQWQKKIIGKIPFLSWRYMLVDGGPHFQECKNYLLSMKFEEKKPKRKNLYKQDRKDKSLMESKGEGG